MHPNLEDRCAKHRPARVFRNLAAVAVLFFALLLPALPSRAATFVSGAISSDTAWTLSGSPYVVRGSLAVASGAVLTIDPGVVVKLDMPQWFHSFSVYGVLNANGAPDGKIYFTSFKDDSAGGDTNGDGAASLPQAQDWTHIFFSPGSAGNFKHAAISYGGRNSGLNACECAMVNFGGNVAMSDSQIAYTNAKGFRQISGSLLLNNIELNNHITALWLENGTTTISAGNIRGNATGISASAGALAVNNVSFSNNSAVPASISAGVIFSHSGNTSSGSPRNGFEMSGTLSADQEWASDAMPYIATNLNVPAGRTLALKEGVIIKFAPRSSFDSMTISGVLNIQGTAANKVYLTSLKDDSAGGDTNNDGAASSPRSGDWTYAGFFSGSSGVISNAAIRYAGRNSSFARCYCAIAVIGGDLAISDSQIASTSATGILHEGGSLSVAGSEINGHYIGLSSSAGNAVISQNSIHDNSNYGVLNYAANTLNAENNWWGSASGPFQSGLNFCGIGNCVSNNVDFIPWLASDPLAPVPPKPDPVIIIPGILGSSDKNGIWVIDPIFHTYDDLIATLDANGYTPGADLFTMPYDWRQSNVLTALQLRNTINDVQAICHCDKVDLVAHSMGGLVARQYIQSDKYENDVDQLIFLGTPHLGSADSYLTWEGGEVGITLRDIFLKFILSREAKKDDFSSLFDYVRNKPISSIRELLPIYDYLRDKDSGVLRTYSNDYPQNAFLENLNTGTAHLFDKGIDITNIVGELGTTSTTNTVRVVPSLMLPLWEHGYPDGFDGSTVDRGMEKSDGDGTVTASSSEFIISDLNKLSSSHRFLPTNAEGLVFKKLTSRDAAVLIRDPRFDIPDFRLLIIKILSPVDVMVIAPDGKRIGKDFAANSGINEIDGAFYSGFLTDDEYITIPNPMDGEYRIETQGTGSGGGYTMAVGYLGDDVSVEREFTATTTSGLITNLDVTVNNVDPAQMEITPEDTTPPQITINSPQHRDYLRSETLPIEADVTDAETGVSSQEFRFDDRIVNNGSVVDLFFENLGRHQVTAFAADFMGNAGSAAIEFQIAATLESTISDVERAYTLGWINKKSVKEKLVKKLEKIIWHDGETTSKTLKSFLHELEKEHTKHINDRVYNLLKEDINWLLNH